MAVPGSSTGSHNVATPTKRAVTRAAGGGPSTPRGEASPAVKARLAELRNKAKLSRTTSTGPDEDLGATTDSLASDLGKSLHLQDDHESTDGRRSAASMHSVASSVRSSRPAEPEVSLGFGMKSIKEEIGRARTSGRLQLSSRSLEVMPASVYESLIPRGSRYHPSNQTGQNSDTSSRSVSGASYSALGFGSRDDDQDDADGPKWWETADLTCLKAANNELSTVDETLAGFEMLEVLDLHSNKITTPLPASFGTLANLTSVNFSNNQLAEFPIEFLALVHLKELDLSGNLLTSLWPSQWKESLRHRMKSIARKGKHRASPNRRRLSSAPFAVEDDSSIVDTSFESVSSQSTTAHTGGRDEADFWGTFPATSATPRAPAYARTADSVDYTRILPHLKSLNLGRNRLKASALSPDAVPDWPQSLTSLNISDNKISSDLLLSKIGALRHLAELDISGNDIADEAFAGILADAVAGQDVLFPSLASINLSRNAMDSLEHFERAFGVGDRRPATYSGCSSSNLQRYLSRAKAPEGETRDTLVTLNVDISANPLRDELRRRRPAKTAPPGDGGNVLHSSHERQNGGDVVTQPILDSCAFEQAYSAVTGTLKRLQDLAEDLHTSAMQDDRASMRHLHRLRAILDSSFVQASSLKLDKLNNGANRQIVSDAAHEALGSPPLQPVHEETLVSAAARRRKLKEAESTWAPL